MSSGTAAAAPDAEHILIRVDALEPLKPDQGAQADLRSTATSSSRRPASRRSPTVFAVAEKRGDVAVLSPPRRARHGCARHGPSDEHPVAACGLSACMASRPAGPAPGHLNAAVSRVSTAAAGPDLAKPSNPGPFLLLFISVFKNFQ